ncbi:hypothetical protein Pcinc_025828 [Petrolisthes cinctipes]|uniref:Uncharacterized protein n=1 Tax=Petrolisthes cinctipes TaxID=88211 RepID=A0AAE1F8F4_PETCI|nr:hypothetical protein Pcinc_025828 [Petrolisthes cinctipes]
MCLNLKIAVAEELHQVEKADIIEKSDSPYKSPFVVEKKKDGGVRILWASLKNKRQRRENQETPAPSLDQNFTCSRCGRTSLSRIGLVSHMRACS